jgi:G3E family GTPase
VADLVEVDAERLEDTGGDPLALADEAQEQVLRADVVVAEPAGLVDRELDHPLRPRRQADLADDRPVAAPDDELDGGADLRQLDVHVLEDARGDALALADEAEQQVLGADVVVVEPLRLVLSKRQDLARAIRELVEAIHRVERLFPASAPDGALEPC